MIGCKALTDTEIQAMKGSLKTARDRALFVLGLKSGFRISELLSLKVSDVMQYGQIVDQVAVQRRHMKKRIEGRSVRLHPEAKDAIQALISSDGLEPHHYLFRSRKASNKPLGRIQAWRILHQAAAANRIMGKVGTHSMRKSFAERVYNKLERDLIKTQRALGHKSINSTVSYLAFAQSEIDQAILEI